MTRAEIKEKRAALDQESRIDCVAWRSGRLSEAEVWERAAKRDCERAWLNLEERVLDIMAGVKVTEGVL
jgi:hypothetical protein